MKNLYISTVAGFGTASEISTEINYVESEYWLISLTSIFSYGLFVSVKAQWCCRL